MAGTAKEGRNVQSPVQTSRYLDLAIKITAGLLVAALVFLAYSLISTKLRDRNSSPAARAAQNLVEAVNADPENPVARLRLADALLAAGDQRGATEQYQEVLKLSPDDPGALAGLATIAMDQGEWRTAEGYWRKIIDVLMNSQFANIDQRLEKAYYYLGSTLMEVKEYEDAARYIKEALRLRPGASDSHFLLGVAYREMDSPLKYREEVELALQFDPLLPEANFELGKILLAEGDVAGAAERFRVSADNAPPERPDPANELAKLGTAEERLAKAEKLLAEGKRRDALVEARVAAALEPANIEASRMIAQIHEKLSEPKVALEAWERVLTIAPGDEEAKEAVARLEGKSE